MTGDELVGYRSGKTPVPTFTVETQQVVAIGVGFADPQFADHAAIGQRFVHLESPQCHVALPGLRFLPWRHRDTPESPQQDLYGALQQKNDYKRFFRKPSSAENA
jgi:hypothetical protein